MERGGSFAVSRATFPAPALVRNLNPSLGHTQALACGDRAAGANRGKWFPGRPAGRAMSNFFR